MEKKVQRISVTSKPGGTYFLQIGWDKDLDKGFTLTLCDGHAAWVGTASAADVSREASDMEMDRKKYAEELKKALVTTAQTANKYSFDLLKDGEDQDVYSFTYEKNLKDVSFKLGSLQLRTVEDPAETIKELINYCLNTATELHNQNEHLQKENERLRCNWNDMHEQLEKCVQAKEELERDLYTRFADVLNEKKKKIRSLNEKVSQVQQKIQEKDTSSIPFDTVPVSDIIKSDDFSGSTDEDIKSSEVTKETAKPTVSRRRSLINSPDDSPDIAPSRKRRNRGRNPTFTELKEKNSQHEEEEKLRYIIVFYWVNGLSKGCSLKDKKGYLSSNFNRKKFKFLVKRIPTWLKV
ncbi:DNA repair protein XRCC4 [Gastrophryne carolinensis]